MKKFWKRFADIFGLSRNSKYVREFLNDANMRSGIFMSAVIIILEVWLIIRQTDKYIIDQVSKNIDAYQYGFFQILFIYTSNFWLLMSFGAAMLFYCVGYKKDKRVFDILCWVFAGISLSLVALMPFEFIFSSKPITGVSLALLIIFYASIGLFNLWVISALIYKNKGGNNPVILAMVVVILFAFVCLVFGVKVSYSDFSSMKTIDGVYQPNPDYKQIICFLMMAIYVGCLLIWKPYVSLGILGTIFIGFYILLKSVGAQGGRKFPDGDEVNYITFFISLTMICISIYDQRVSEAKKDEELEELATKDTLTGLWSFEYFTTLVSRKLKEDSVKIHEWAYLFMDITSFKTFNDQKGFEEGNRFLNEVAHILTNTFPDGLVSRQSDDHYIVFCKDVEIIEKLGAVEKEVEKLDLDIRPGIKVGGYLLRDKNENPHASIEKARYACAELKHSQFGNFLKYDKEMHDNYRLIQYIVRHIDTAIEHGYIVPYYQPVTWSKGRKLCGVEALARWIDPKYGFLSPAKFIPALENSQLIYKLDIAILRLVCKRIRENIDSGEYVLPVSINFSRIDFKVCDIVSIIDQTIKEFDIPRNLLHIEITESALNDDVVALKESIKRLHDLGFEVWLDDFGSGYSSFNVLKDFDFDVLKLDMAFLKGFEDNKKSHVLIQSVIDMADQIGIKTLSEGVETKEEAEFLEKISCGRLQGYLYGKPIPYEEFKTRIEKGELILSDEVKKQNMKIK